MLRQILITTAVVCLAAATGIVYAQASNTSTPAASGTAMPALTADPNAPAQFSTSELEDTRTQLLNMEAALEQLSGLAPPNSVDLTSLQQAKAGIQQMPYQHLNALRHGLSPSGVSSRLSQARQHMQSYLAKRASGQPTGRQLVSQQVSASPSMAFPAPNTICNPSTMLSSVENFAESGPEQLLFGANGGSLTVSGSIGVNGSLGDCSIDLCFSGSASVGASLTATAPSTPTTTMGASVSPGSAGVYDPQALPNMRISEDVILGADVVWFLAEAIREFSGDACKQDILGENARLACIAVDALWVVAKAVDTGIHYCDSDLTTQVTDSSYSGLSYIYGNLYSIGNALDTHIGTTNTEVDTRLGTANTEIDTRLATANTDVDTRIAALSAQLATLNTQVAGQFATLANQIANLVTCLKNPPSCGLIGGGGPSPLVAGGK